MKTAISLPDPLFEAADALAERLGVSRSQLFATAVAEFLAKHHGRKITERLDAVYGREADTVEPDVRRAQARSVESDTW